MNIHSVRRSLAGGLLAVAALLLASCGGGGAASSTGSVQGGILTVLPTGATFFAGVPNTISINGGRRPYTLTSSEPSVLPVPLTLNGNSIQVVPANPGVIDAGLQPGDLPVRTVNITARDVDGAVTTAVIKVAQNFLTGYGISLTSNCPAATGGTAPSACAGGETVVTLRPVTNGNLFGDRPVRFEVIRGPFQFEQFPDRTVLGNTVTTTTDHTGTATVIMRVNSGVLGQFGVLRIVDVATGVYTDQVFTISASGPQSTLTAIPNSFTFTGPLQGICGTGSGSFLVFDGVPPYTALSSDPNIRVSPTSTGSNPALFTVTATNPNVCSSNATIIVTDSLGGRTTVTVNTVEGTNTPPAPTPVTVAPTSITLLCGTSGSVSVVGGTGSFFVNSTHPRVTAVASGNTVTITRLAGDAGAAFPTTATISITDGNSVATVNATVPATCP